jgi:hypothetical protein
VLDEVRFDGKASKSLSGMDRGTYQDHRINNFGMIGDECLGAVKNLESHRNPWTSPGVISA